ncbi:MAG: nucleotidyltransferase family protein [Cyanobacteria bacterium MAG IRC1_bin_28]|uniref:Nucleotidyltransferase family protein n=1 Tax=Synechococcus sp. SB0676_bin_10 TaxID=2604869 RepID=A0A6B1F5U7_9SYNE|nr:nucleotidyltransferase family protein [Cyanobacteria bacterium MAG IRC3_bin_20]MCY3654348.1 nucleotidyltransferase family protein [Cyanobacteria bacterium MAG IRC1_bin_28]MYG38720.1 nucleotidyltransferase family protein [Synechococcus sp. SB0676_bin_10]MYK07487.1 nucleotidyltransferase family protein [Synechococcus sp. SB0670_bin_20]
MGKATVLNQLRAHKAAMAQRFGVVDPALFGSFARGEAADASHVDILVRFDAAPLTSARYFGARFYIEDLPGRPVDMATRQGLRAEIRSYVEENLIDV